MRNALFSAFVAVLMLPIAACDSNDNNEPELGTIVETAIDANFNTLVTAVQAAELVDVLNGTGPFTVFAPTDAAFGDLPAGTLDDLLLPQNKSALAGVLTYHVVSGRVTAAEVVNLTSATTVQGATLDISVDAGNVFINGVQVIQTDVEASNGVIHVIDGVLLPPAN